MSGALPKGLSLDAVTGLLTGTPQDQGMSRFTIRVSDAGGLAERALTLKVNRR